MNINKNKTFYVPKTLQVGSVFVIEGQEHTHLKNVMRISAGQQINVINNTEHSFVCEVESVEKNQTTCSVQSKELCQANAKASVTCFVGLCKGEKLELIVQKLTELGVSKIVPFYSNLCIAKPSSNKKERLEQIAISACKQCGRSIAPTITDTINFKELLKQIAGHKVCYFANESESKKGSIEASENTAFIVGSEGGFTAEECKQIEQTTATSICLGKRILRAETAAIALASIIMHANGEI